MTKKELKALLEELIAATNIRIAFAEKIEREYGVVICGVDNVIQIHRGFLEVIEALELDYRIEPTFVRLGSTIGKAKVNTLGVEIMTLLNVAPAEEIKEIEEAMKDGN